MKPNWTLILLIIVNVSIIGMYFGVSSSQLKSYEKLKNESNVELLEGIFTHAKDGNGRKERPAIFMSTSTHGKVMLYPRGLKSSAGNYSDIRKGTKILAEVIPINTIRFRSYIQEGFKTYSARKVWANDELVVNICSEANARNISNRWKSNFIFVIILSVLCTGLIMLFSKILKVSNRATPENSH